MYKSNIYINETGHVVADTEYKGPVAFYLKNNNVYVEKVHYSVTQNHIFNTLPKSGAIQVVFFFKSNNGDIVKYETELYRFVRNNNNLKVIITETIADEDGFKISHYDQNSEVTFVTFNIAGSNKESPSFGQGFVLKNGWNLITVAQKKDTQYQCLDTNSFYKYVYPIVDGKKVFTYGSSLGGYCALFFGGCINATIIAASPRNSAHDSIRHPRYSNVKFIHESFEKISTSTSAVYIVFDPTVATDVKYLKYQVLMAYPNCNVLELNNASHAVVETMLRAQVLNLYIYSIVNDKYDSNVSKYITARYEYYQKEYEKAFLILDNIVRDNLKLN